MVQSWYHMVILRQTHVLHEFHEVCIYMVGQGTFDLGKPIVVLIGTFLEVFWKCYSTFPCQRMSISLQCSCSTLPSEYGSEILNWLARKTSPLWLIVISVRGSSSNTRLTDWIQAPSRFCRHNKGKLNQGVRTSHTSTHIISSYRTTASNTMDECHHRETNLSDHRFQFGLIQ